MILEFLPLRPLQDHRDKPLTFAGAADDATIGIFMVAYSMVVGLWFPGAAILRRAGGFLFSAVPRTLFGYVVAATGPTLTS